MSESNGTPLIVSAVKLYDYGHGMFVEILDVLAGDETRTNVMVWGDNGLLCRVPTVWFDVGDTLIMALGKAWPGFVEIENEEDYELSICGLHHLGLSNGMVSGNIDGVANSMPYDDFVLALGGCLTETGACTAAPPDWLPQLAQEPNSIKILPTPELEPLVFSLEIFDSSGRRLLVTESGQTSIDTHNLPDGVYIIRFNSPKGTASRKLSIIR